MLGRIYKKLTGSTAKFLLMLGGLLGIGVLPCPECGTPMIFHVWPLAGMVLVVRAMIKHNRKIEAPGAGALKVNGNPFEK